MEDRLVQTRTRFPIVDTAWAPSAVFFLYWLIRWHRTATVASLFRHNPFVSPCRHHPPFSLHLTATSPGWYPTTASTSDTTFLVCSGCGFRLLPPPPSVVGCILRVRFLWSLPLLIGISPRLRRTMFWISGFSWVVSGVLRDYGSAAWAWHRFYWSCSLRVFFSFRCVIGSRFCWGAWLGFMFFAWFTFSEGF